MTNYKKHTFLFLFLFVALFSYSASAHAAGVGFPYWPNASTPLISCSGDYTGYQHEGSVPPVTCTSLCDVIETFRRILYFAMTLILFIGSPLMFVIGGGMVMFAGANPQLLATGKKTIWGAVIGVVLALAAYVIVGTFLWMIGNPPEGSKVPVKNEKGEDVLVDAPRASWPDVSCNPKTMPGGQLQLWGGNAKSGQSGSDVGNASSSKENWSGCKGSVVVCHYNPNASCSGKDPKDCQCVTGKTQQECDAKR